MAQPHVNKEQIAELMIPIPPIEKQLEIVQAVNKIQNRIDRLILELDDSQNDYKKLNRLMIGEEYHLGQICSFKNGKAITKSKLIEGPYPVVGGGQTPMGYHIESNFPEKTIIISKSGAYAGFVSRYDIPIYGTADALCIDQVNPSVLSEYLYLVLKYNLQETIFKF